jgi:hypothetical protein
MSMSSIIEVLLLRVSPNWSLSGGTQLWGSIRVRISANKPLTVIQCEIKEIEVSLSAANVLRDRSTIIKMCKDNTSILSEALTFS